MRWLYTSVSRHRWLLLGVCGVAAALVTWKAWSSSREEAHAADAIRTTVTAILSGDMRRAKQHAYGNELEQLGISEDAYTRYVRALLEGYISSDAEVSVVRDSLELNPPTSAEMERLQERLRENDRRRPSFRLRVARSDGKPPIECPTFAIKGPGGWMVSTRAMVAWLEGSYSDNPKERYAKVLRALQDAGIDKMCSPSGHWIQRERLALFIEGKISEKDIFDETLVVR